MKIIVVSQKHSRPRTFLLGRRLKGLLSLLAVCVAAALCYLGYEMAFVLSPRIVTVETAQDWRGEIDRQNLELAELRQQSEMMIDALTVRLAMQQARLARIEAMGERVTDITGLSDGEFDFNQPVALGGPFTNETGSRQADDTVPGVHGFSGGMDDLIESVAQLESRVDDRQQQLGILELVLDGRKINLETRPTGRPMERAWMTSNFGYRPDPFTGRRAFHRGVDFANGRTGAPIVSVAAGVVIWSGPRTSYGLMVEIDHGNGYKTRYAHAEKLLVKVGDVVMKGQQIGQVGSTGRSTGPHLHFEVHKDGRAVDPTGYVNGP